MGIKVTDHRTGTQNLKRVRDIMNGKIQPPPTVEEILAAESARQGVPLVVVKNEDK